MHHSPNSPMAERACKDEHSVCTHFSQCEVLFPFHFTNCRIPPWIDWSSQSMGLDGASITNENDTWTSGRSLELLLPPYISSEGSDARVECSWLFSGQHTPQKWILSDNSFSISLFHSFIKKSETFINSRMKPQYLKIVDVSKGPEKKFRKWTMFYDCCSLVDSHDFNNSQVKLHPPQVLREHSHMPGSYSTVLSD